MLVLDEPTASLDAAEAARLLHIVRELKGRGLAIVFISHFLDQVYAIADRMTVLRNGRRVGVGTPQEIPPAKLVPLMLGRELEAVEHGRRSPHGAIRASRSWSRKGSARRASWRRSTSRCSPARRWVSAASSARAARKAPS